jgi:hypothetical protein
MTMTAILDIDPDDTTSKAIDWGVGQAELR